MKTVHVAVGVIRQKNQILIAKRPDHVHQGGFWEFPGGKVEDGESVPQALQRELFEELNIESGGFKPLIQIPYQYPDKKVFLDVYWVREFSGEAHGREGQPIQWVDIHKLSNYTFPAANRPILQAITLPSDYAITSSKTNQDLLQKMEIAAKAGIHLMQLRTNQSIDTPWLEGVLRLLAQYPINLQINSNTWEKILTQEQKNLLLHVPANLRTDSQIKAGQLGIHYTSQALTNSKKTIFPGMQSASCHTLDDIERANDKQLDFIVLSPVLETVSHPEQPGMGWQRFHQLVSEAQIPVYALGGMTQDHKELAITHGAQGIAGISGFWSL